MTLAGLLIASVLAQVPTPSAPPLPEPARRCERTVDCEKGFACLGYRELSPGQWTRGSCTALPTPVPEGAPPPLLVSCVTNTDCAGSERCTDFRNLGGGKWTRGVCLDPSGFRDPRAVDPRYLGGALVRRPYTGTVPPGFGLVTEPNWLAITPGIITFATSWVVASSIAFATGRAEGAVPIAGPILWSASGNVTGALLAAAVTDALLQSIGASLIIYGLAAPRRFVESLPSVTIAPTPNGAVISGAF
jgi:hypothetical protein